MPSPEIVGAILIALAGWFATLLVLNGLRIARRKKLLLFLPSWLPWIALALGAPVLSGMLPLPTAFGIGSAMTMGMIVSMVLRK